MHLIISTPVKQSLPVVWSGFDRTLFDKLSPPFPPVHVVRFDGCLKGDVVHLQLDFFLFKQDWISLIVDQQQTEQEIFFVDEGTRLPFFLQYWQHRHRLVRIKSADVIEQTLIIDDITFKTPFWLMDYLIYPVLWLQFAYRKPIYRKMFNRGERTTGS